MIGTGEEAWRAHRASRGTRAGAVTGHRARDGAARRRELAAATGRSLLLAAVLAGACSGRGTSIHDVQGRGLVSPHLGESTTVEGVVTAVLEDGLFLQSRRTDWSRGSSEALFVSPRVEAEPGDVVRVRGRVAERSRDQRELTVTTLEIAPERSPLEVLRRGAPLPPPVTLRSLPADLPSALERWESLEGMVVEIAAGEVVGPTNRFGEAVLLLAGNATSALPRTPAGGLALVAAAADAPYPFRVLIDDALAPLPEMSVGQRLAGSIRGVVDYRYGTYRVLPFSSPSVHPGENGTAAIAPPPVFGPDALAVATFNVENLDVGDEPSRFRRLAEVVVHSLGSPDLVALQEIQDDSGERDDGTVSSDRAHRRLIAAIGALGGPLYLFREVRPIDNQDGGAPGANIRVSLLVRSDRGVVPVDRAGEDPSRRAAVAQLDENGEVTVSPSPGRLGVDDPAFRDTRKPLVVQLEVDGERLFVVVCHLSSKRTDDLPFGAVQPPRRTSEPQRVAQTRLIARFVSDLATLDPDVRILVLGDLNDFPFSAPLAELEAAGLVNAVLELPPEERYTYVHQGVSQALDHILLSPSLIGPGPPQVTIAHVNAEQPHRRRVSDHDPVLVRVPRRRPAAASPTASPNGASTRGNATTGTAGAPRSPS